MSSVLQKPACFFDNFDRKPSQQQTTHYCPGCGHGVLNKLIAQSISELGIQDKTIVVSPVGCGVFLYYYFQCAAVSAPHGRASAVATGVSRSNPDGITIAYQGDGDLAAIGTNNAIHAANRGENMIVFFVNNTIYGMTGGQLAPTTLIGQKTTTSPYGRSEKNDGPPLRMAEIIATLDSPVLVARVGVNSPKNVRQAHRIIGRGLEAQRDKKGYVFIEVLSQCPTNWRKSPIEACRWIDDELIKKFPIGILKDTIDEAQPVIRKVGQPDFDQIAGAIGLDYEKPQGTGIQKLPFDEVHFKAAGFGGQGVLSLGLFIASAAMKLGCEVTWLPSYGPEMRGGVANCSVVIGHDHIASPIVERPNILVAMNKPSMFKFAPTVSEGGFIFYNSSLIDKLPESIRAGCYPIPATDMAGELGNTKAANTIMLGHLAAQAGLFSLDDLARFLKDTFADEELYRLNAKALETGFSYRRSP